MSNPEVNSSIERAVDERRIPFEELSNLFASLDLEPKCILLSLMSNHHVYGRNELNKLLIHAQGYNPGWLQSERMGWEYCIQSFKPIGLVAEELVDKDLGTIGFIKTPRGSHIGTALAGHLLNISKDCNYSLHELFGGTSSSAPSKEVELHDHSESISYKKRSPGVRLKIYQALSAQDIPGSANELAQLISEDRAIVGRHLRDLARLGIVNYGSTVFGFFDKDRDTVNNNFTKSSIRITETQKKLISSLADLTINFEIMDKDTLGEGLFLASEIANNSNDVAMLMAKAREASPQGNKTSESTTISDIVLFLQENEALTSGKIRDMLIDRDKTLSEQRIRSILRKMRESGLAVGEKSNNGSMQWRLIKSE